MPKPSTLLNQWLNTAYERKEITYDEKKEILYSSEVFYHIAETEKVDFKNTTWNPDFFLEYGGWFESWLKFLSDKHIAPETQTQGCSLGIF